MFKEALSVLIFCVPSNHRWPFSYDMKMVDFKYFRAFVHFLVKNKNKKIGNYTQKSVLNIGSSDSQINKLQHGCPKRIELLDVNINTGVQSINTELV